MHGFQVILVFCVVTLAYCHNGHAKTTSNEQLTKGLLGKELLLPEDVHELLKNYNQPITIKLAELNEHEESHCRLAPLDSMKIEISESWDSKERHESLSLRNYLAHCEKLRKDNCGEKAFVDRDDDTLSREFSSKLSDDYAQQPDEIFSLLEPYALDSNIFPWLRFGRGSSKCRYKRDMIRNEVTNSASLRVPISIQTFILTLSSDLFWFHCRKESSAHLRKFRDRLKELFNDKNRNKEQNLNELVKALGSIDLSNRQKLNRNEINVIKDKYLVLENDKKNQFLSCLDCKPDQKWERLLDVCKWYTSNVTDNVEEFILGVYEEDLRHEWSMFLALTICHDLLYAENEKEKPYHFDVQTRVHSIAAKYRLDIPTKKGYYLDVIYD